MIFDGPREEITGLRSRIRAAHKMDEASCVTQRLKAIDASQAAKTRIQRKARSFVQKMRQSGTQHALDAFMRQYDLASNEGIVLMCLAEALLRIPDAHTADLLIKDKIGGAEWAKHFGQSESFLVNASTWALMLTGRVLDIDSEAEGLAWRSVLGKLVSRASEPVVRTALTQSMRLMGEHFVVGRTMPEAIEHARDYEERGYFFSYDMLGEAAMTREDAERYFESYADAINQLATRAKSLSIFDAPGISIKLSSLHPRYNFAQEHRVKSELLPDVVELAKMAQKAGVGICIDAEEADRLDLSLDLIEAMCFTPELKGWDGLGFAVQAYQKRAMPLIAWLINLSTRSKNRLMIRLVKGAYWDTEIKSAQVEGLSDYPVFTRKASTDVSYLSCAQRMLKDPKAIYSCFATHNAHTLAAVMEYASGQQEFEFQRLFGMGNELYDQIVEPGGAYRCRIYAPVGGHEQLLPYLMRRLLENGANTSFVNRIADDDLSVEKVIKDPAARIRAFKSIRHPDIPLPRDLFGSQRVNSKGLDLADLDELLPLRNQVLASAETQWKSAPIVSGVFIDGAPREVCGPFDSRHQIGTVVEASPATARHALSLASGANSEWDACDVRERAALLRKAAQLFEDHFADFTYLLISEAGKTLADANGEVREAVDFLRYYAKLGTDTLGPMTLPGPTGERNTLFAHGRGVFLCISPWNFPLAIFTGQIAAALVTGNGVLAKPAEQTPLIAAFAIKLLHQAGIPVDVLHLLPGDGPSIGAALLSDARIAGVCFTGSTETAHIISRQLAERDGPIASFIAETGGQNAMIVDSSALPEQAVTDVLSSAFQSTGQRCSALRVLFLQREVAETISAMVAGAMGELALGNPAYLSTDIGPVIDQEALDNLQRHHQRMKRSQHVIYQCKITKDCRSGFFSPPTAYRIKSIDVLKGEVFGPCLHVIEYEADELDNVIDAINGTSFGLTLAIHSRINSAVRYIRDRVRVGNTYINRNQIGAVVGSQPFGGEGLSGTGPKAGGPHYLSRFTVERSVSTNLTAVGGNADLMSLGS